MMKGIHEEYHKRNVLLVRICWLQVLLFSGLYYLYDFPLYTYIDIATEILLIIVPLEILNRSRKFTLYVPYVFGTAFMLMLVVCNLFFSYYLEVRTLNPFSFLISAALLAQYPSIRPILYYGGLSVAVLNVFFLTGFEIGQIMHPVLMMNYFVILMVGLLAFSTRLTQRYYQAAEKLNQETNLMKRRMESLWDKITDWGLQLKDDSRVGGTVEGERDLFELPKEELEVRLEALIAESERQMKAIEDKNRTLEAYSEQIEQLTLQEERNRVSRELHDQIGHTYTGMTMGLESIKYIYKQSPEEAEAKIDHLLGLIRKSFEEVRSSIHQMADEAKDEQLSVQLKPLLEQYAMGMKVQFAVVLEGAEPDVPSNVRHVLYRCLQESLTNARRHGQAGSVDVELRYEEDRIVLSVSDDGIGAENLEMGFGLRGMRERLAALQGRLKVSSRAGKGVEVVCTVPLSKHYEHKEIRLVIADDQPLVRESLSLLFGREPDLDVVATAADGLAAVELCLAHQPNLVLLDLNMPGLDGIEVTRRLKAECPEVRIILLTTFDDRSRAAEAIRYGAEGYLLKTIHPHKLIDALRLVYSGGTLMSQEIARQLADGAGVGASNPLHAPSGAAPTGAAGSMPMQTPSPAASIPTPTPAIAALQAQYGLTEREIEILQLLARGMTYRQIAETLMFSENTIRNYISILYSKLSADNKTQAIEKAREAGYLAG